MGAIDANEFDRLRAGLPPLQPTTELILRPDGDQPLAMLRPVGEPPRADGAADWDGTVAPPVDFDVIDALDEAEVVALACASDSTWRRRSPGSRRAPPRKERPRWLAARSAVRGR